VRLACCFLGALGAVQYFFVRVGGRGRPLGAEWPLFEEITRPVCLQLPKAVVSSRARLGQLEDDRQPKACREFESASQPARAAGTQRPRVLCTQWDPGSAQIQQEWAGSTPYSRWSCHILATECATEGRTEGVPSEVVECEA